MAMGEACNLVYLQLGRQCKLGSSDEVGDHRAPPPLHYSTVSDQDQITNLMFALWQPITVNATVLTCTRLAVFPISFPFSNMFLTDYFLVIS